MNMHLAKLHMHVFTRDNYGVEVKVFPNSSGVRRYTFPVNWKFKCAVALAHVTHAQCFEGKYLRRCTLLSSVQMWVRAHTEGASSSLITHYRNCKYKHINLVPE